MASWMGNFVSRHSWLIVAAWLTAWIGLRLTAPDFDRLTKSGEFVFLPDSMPSRLAEDLMNRAFPGRQTTSSIVVVAHRESGAGLTDDDNSFIDDSLRPRLEKLRDKLNKAIEQPSARAGKEAIKSEPFLGEIHSYSDPGIGKLLVSEDHTTSLITMDLNRDFMDTANWKAVDGVASELKELQESGKTPEGLSVGLTGSATLGRDLGEAEAQSARNTGPLTILLVIILLVVIYRAPLMALIPLCTLFIAIDVSLCLLAALAQAGYVPLFKGLREYTTVITYGPGIDYCLFQIARYKENLKRCLPASQAIADTVRQVSPALAASAGTVICGIGMLTFAQFGKFHEAGLGIGCALIITSLATLTLTPALLRIVGHWAFWPKPGFACNDAGEKAEEETKQVQQNMFQPLWSKMGGIIERHPLGVMGLTLAAMLPFVIIAVIVYRDVNFGLLEALPLRATSAQGAKILEQHFPAGITGPVNVLVQNQRIDFSESDGNEKINDLVNALMKRHEELHIADIRSVATPLGAVHPEQENATADSDSFVSRLFTRKITNTHGNSHYVSTAGELAGHVTQMDIVLTVNPFSTQGVESLERLEAAIHQLLPKEISESVIRFSGPTSSVRDLNVISDKDQWRIYQLVVISVLLILVILLRSVTLSVYLILTVLFSYMATIGVTWLVFYALSPEGFVGLDWTVPLFLFVVLIAVGEDYNIFLVTRIHEEQVVDGPTRGITTALAQTGGIITSCGFIMAGTFASLSIGTLARMQQLGFALAFGVLLDTFVVRPILVPAFLMMLSDSRFGNLSRYAK